MTVRLTDLEDLVVVDARGRSVGRVSRALFDPADPVLVGFEVRMRPFGYLIERPLRYVPRSGVSLTSKKVKLSRGTRLEKVGGRHGGLDWEQTVIWTGMPVQTVSGRILGQIKEVDLDAEGRVTRVVMTRGATSDVAVGTREVAGDCVVGFSDGAVRLDDRVDTPDFSGGLAAGAGKGAAVAKVNAERAAKGAVSAAVVAARAAKRSPLLKRTTSSWKGFTEGIKEGMADDTPAEK